MAVSATSCFIQRAPDSWGGLDRRHEMISVESASGRMRTYNLQSKSLGRHRWTRNELVKLKEKHKPMRRGRAGAGIRVSTRWHYRLLQRSKSLQPLVQEDVVHANLNARQTDITPFHSLSSTGPLPSVRSLSVEPLQLQIRSCQSPMSRNGLTCTIKRRLERKSTITSW